MLLKGFQHCIQRASFLHELMQSVYSHLLSTGCAITFSHFSSRKYYGNWQKHTAHPVSKFGFACEGASSPHEFVNSNNRIVIVICCHSISQAPELWGRGTKGAFPKACNLQHHQHFWLDPCTTAPVIFHKPLQVFHKYKGYSQPKKIHPLIT